MDTLYTRLVNAGQGPRISDGVDYATTLASSVFPYLAPPNPVRPDRPQLANILQLVRPRADAHA